MYIYIFNVVCRLMYMYNACRLIYLNTYKYSLYIYIYIYIYVCVCVCACVFVQTHTETKINSAKRLKICIYLIPPYEQDVTEGYFSSGV